ncbi:MAG: hypothetical protein GY941_05890 [Planctomycetes bacterium]|nr:hypothetical protein [Planctomycetota bacterium]
MKRGIQINNIPKDEVVTKEEMKAVFGGGTQIGALSPKIFIGLAPREILRSREILEISNGL